MAYYSPCQRQSDGRWDMTCSNSSGTFPIGYCHAWRDDPSPDAVARLGPWFEASWRKERAAESGFRHKYHDCGHATSLEASSCYRTYELDHLRVDDGGDDPQTTHACQAPGCDEWTPCMVQVGEYSFYHVCAAHRTRAVIEALHTRPRKRQDGT